MVRSRNAGVLVPTIYFVDTEKRRIIMEMINGVTLKYFLANGGNTTFIQSL